MENLDPTPPVSGMHLLAEPSLAAKAAYDKRWQRIMDCVALKQSDRMPVALFTTFWLAKYGGISIRDNMYDYEKVADIMERACLEFEPDITTPVMENASIGNVLEATGFKQLQWPGHGVGDNQPYQYLDREYMMAHEYDDFLLDPTGFFLGKYLPRVAGAFEGLEPLASLSGNMYYGISFASILFCLPQVQEALGKLAMAGGAVANHMNKTGGLVQRLRCLGFPYGFGAFSGAPYDVVADYMRGAKGMMTDLYRHKEKLEEVFDKVRKLVIRQTIAMAKMNGNPLVFIPLHWAPDAFMSQKQFEKFWWPSFRQFMLDLIDADLIPVPMWEADCTKRLEVIKDIPAGKCIYWFERTDMVKAFEVLGDVVALRGNISASALTTGTPEDVDKEVRRLGDQVWNKGGSLILDAAFGIPDESSIENVRAMFSAARKYAG
ncbi:MAG: hypothetical protein EKK46_10740 [Rhodocyclaceae bacterium]|nr:MAG: hypothetical protein EKK46_10740 [Rhodocyclaceae bacterium]